MHIRAGVCVARRQVRGARYVYGYGVHECPAACERTRAGQTWCVCVCARAPVRIQCSVRECAARAGLCLLPSLPSFGDSEW